jgi:hypothetical protein
MGSLSKRASRQSPAALLHYAITRTSNVPAANVTVLSGVRTTLDDLRLPSTTIVRDLRRTPRATNLVGRRLAGLVSRLQPRHRVEIVQFAIPAEKRACLQG